MQPIDPADGLIEPLRFREQHSTGRRSRPVRIEHALRIEASDRAQRPGEHPRILPWTRDANLHAEVEVAGEERASLRIPDHVVIGGVPRSVNQLPGRWAEAVTGARSAIIATRRSGD